MKRNEYYEILCHFAKLKTKEEKMEFLFNSIESIDYDGNGFNDELIRLYNKLKDEK